mmetsp:Transcript_26188/g.19675  ORF Transcript_26188/g.19675 Transcript_26188/m.19675 type:complete len:134 (+) Transcript_26188:994-1395(+)
MDRLAKIWNTKGEVQGILRQGYMLRPSYLWNFPLRNYNEALEVRQGGVNRMLKDVRKKRDDERSLKRHNMQMKQAAGTSYGGKYILGMNQTQIKGINQDLGFATAPVKGENQFQQASKLNFSLNLGESSHLGG